MRHLFLVNPTAGRGDAVGQLRSLVEAAFSAGEAEFVVTDHAGHARELARQAAETGEPVRLYACGGDGTLNEVVNGAAGFDNAAVTHVPMGTGNDFLRIFGEGLPLFRRLDLLKDGPQAAFDLIDCGGILGLDVVCAGLDARVASQVHRYKRLPLVGGPGAYVLALVAELFRGLCRPMRVEMGDLHHDGPTAILCVCNGRYYGGGFCPVPEAMPDDGVLDVLLIGSIGLPTFLRYVSKYAKGRYRECADIVQHYHGDRVVLSAPQDFALVVDGEVLWGNSFTLALSPKKVNFFYPTGASYRLSGSADRECAAV